MMKTEKDIPQLRFPEFKGEWENIRLEKIVTNIKSGNTKPNKEGKYNVYGSTGMIGKADNFTHEGQSILIARVGANAGLINLVCDKYCVTDNTLIVELLSQYSYHYIFYRLIKFNINRLIFGSGQPLVTAGELKKLVIKVPSLPEQQKIASFLSSADQRIHLLTQKKEKLDQYKKGIMQQIFSQQLRFKDENGKDYPDWEEKRLGEIAVFYDSKRKPLSDSDRSKRKGPYPYYGASGIIDYIDDYIFEGEFVLLGEDGANIISRNSKLAFVVKGKIWINNHAHVIQAKGSNYFLAESLERIRYEKYNTGTVQPKLNIDVCRKIVLNVPIIKEQQKIASFLSSLDQKISLVNQQIELTRKWKQGLLQKMFV